MLCWELDPDMYSSHPFNAETRVVDAFAVEDACPKVDAVPKVDTCPEVDVVPKVDAWHID